VNATRTLSVLTVVNLALLAYQVVLLQKADSAILRGRGIEIVDGQGRLRMQLTVAPANDTFKMPDGKTGYPETVILRLITADGKPRVKLTTSTEGSGLMLLGDSDTTHTILEAHGATTSLKLRNNETTERVLKP
jgi:hypothetical protein